ncbi:MAG: hypothetical protein JSW10_03080 [Pseudomonadota bacterium]|nr:MAG: hypothetical protein JSW10_03080 [Pseudomonadota bacterium]
MSGLVVKAHRPWLSRLLLALMVLAGVVGGWSLYEYGRYRAGYDGIAAEQERDQLAATLDERDDEVRELREKVAVLERAAQVERQAYDEVKASLLVLQDEMLELNEELAFYRGIVSPRQAAEGLQLQSFRLEPNGLVRGYRYKIVLTQVLKNTRSTYGKVKLRLEGMADGRSRVLGLADVSQKKVSELDYRFKYFQALEGNIELPKGFKPQRVAIQVLPRGKSKSAIEKTFDWHGEERSIDVGKREKPKTGKTERED